MRTFETKLGHWLVLVIFDIRWHFFSGHTKHTKKCENYINEDTSICRKTKKYKQIVGIKLR